MLGAIMGDVSGSPWEGGCCRDNTFLLFADGGAITDDSICTIAVAEALLTGNALADTLRNWCRAHPGLGYGSQFNLWVYRPSMGPYNSWGNGGAMRASPCGWLATSLDQAEQLAEQTAAITHNHPEGLRGARAIAGTLWMARQGMSGPQLLQEARRYGYPLGLSVQERAALEPGGCDAVDTVPIALDCALQAASVADAIHRAVYIGGDSDTTASMAAAIAEARFGLSDDEVAATLTYLSEPMAAVVRAFYAQLGLRVGGLRHAPPRKDGPPPASLGRRGPLSCVLTWLTGH